MAVNLSRQSDIFDQDKLASLRVLIVGAGGIGSNLLHLFLSMGVTEIHIADFDAVGEENVAPGWFSLRDISRAKVDVLAAKAAQDFDTEIYPLYGNIEHMQYLDELEFDIVVACTDSLESRALAFSILSDTTKWWIDARMGGTGIEIYVASPESFPEYERTLDFRAEPLPCGQKATAPLTKGIIVGLVGQALYDIVSGRPPSYYSAYDMAADPTHRLITAR